MSTTTSSSRSTAGTVSADGRSRTTRVTTAMTVAIADITSPISPSGKQRTLDDIRNQVAEESAVHAITKADSIDGVRVGVALTLSKNDDEQFLRKVASKIKHTLLLQQYLFAIATTGPTTSGANSLIICGSSDDLVQRAVLLASSKFLSRVHSVYNEGTRWVAVVQDIGTSSYDEVALWDIVRKSARKPMDPLRPPPGSRGIDQILAEARSKIQRVTPAQAYEELHDTGYPMPVFLVDIRPVAQREQTGGIHGSLIIERNVLEWRFDPRGNADARLAIADRYDLRVIIFCQEGYTSSLAAASLQEIGLLNATDIIGGYAAWKEAGLPSFINPPASLGDSASWTRSPLSV